MKQNLWSRIKPWLAIFALAIGTGSGDVYAFQIWSAGGTSDTAILVNSKNGGPALQQDMINNINSPQVTRSFGYVFGRNAVINNVACDLWSGPTCVYVFPATPMQMAVVSTSANDSATGTGIQKLHIHYLDTNYNEQSEIITLNGLTPVNTAATNILRINAMHATQVGTGGQAAGNVSLTNVGGTVTYGYILAGFNTAKQAIYTVPSAKYGYISHWQASSGTVTGTHFTSVYLRATAHAGVATPGVFLTVDEVGTLNSGQEISLPIPIRIPPMTDVKLSAMSDAANANAQVMGAIMGWFENQ